MSQSNPGMTGTERPLRQRGWLALLSGYMLVLIVLGLAIESPSAIWRGLLDIWASPGLLLSDYLVIGGVGAALVNAGVVGLSGLLLSYANGVLLSGPTVAAVFTMAGFGLFGKNVWSIWPVILGVVLFSRVVRRPFKSYIIVALFGTALAPLVTTIAYSLGWGVPAGILFGLAAGFVLPPLAVYMLRLHQGLNIYNVGLTCGFLGLFVVSLLEGAGSKIVLAGLWSEQHSDMMSLFLLLYALSMLAVGTFLTRRWTDLRDLVREEGTLPTDFVESYGAGITWINMGLVGLIGWLYIWLVGGVFNGPTVGGVLTMIGFAAFGKHILNVLPLMLGVYLGSRLMIWQPNQPGPLLAALFSTTLAPISGRFGPLVGIIAGVLHLTLVMRTASWHGGLNLYNNGFAGGLTATLLVGIITWWTNWKEERKR
ncbi:MAG: DUF1576 domain-containing protein [Anaerolineae bacterium]|nr:DUF1576 domain-containing protein [Anaerolineae bacterium]